MVLWRLLLGGDRGQDVEPCGSAGGGDRCDHARQGKGVGWSFAGAGLVAWSRRPENRTGAMMVAVGLAYLLNGLLF